MLKIGLVLCSPVAAVFCLLAVTGCASEGTDVLETIAFSPFASSGAPMSTTNHIAILSEEIVCVTDSYEACIHCMDRVEGTVTVFGGKGRGPGELEALSGIERGRAGHVAALDFGVGGGRLSLFSPDGNLMSETRMPSGFQLTLLRGGHLLGFELVTPTPADFSEGLFQPSYVPQEVDASSGEVLWERTDLADAVDRECFNPAVGVSTPDGGLVFHVCEYELVFLITGMPQRSPWSLLPATLKRCPMNVTLPLM